MGCVLPFERPAPKQAAEHDAQSSKLDAHLLSFAENAQAIGVDTAAIKKDLRVIHSIMGRTEDPELCGRLLQQMKAVKYQLHLVSQALRHAKNSVRKPDGGWQF